MAVYTVKGSQNIPSNCLRLTEEEALNLQKTTIRDWKKSSEVNGQSIASLTIALSGTYLTAYYFKKFYLSASPIIASLLIPFCVVPTYVTSDVYDRKITNNILLMKMSCPICSYMSYVLSHMFASFVYPATSAIACFTAIAEKQGTIAIPNFETDPKRFYRFLGSFLNPRSQTLQKVIGLNALVIIFLPFMQSMEFQNLSKIINEAESSKEMLF